MERARIAELAASQGFAEIAADLARLACPSVRLRITPEVDGPFGSSRIGGMPDLPVGTAWPKLAWLSEPERSMSFIAQFALAHLDPAVWASPRDGLLSVFCLQDLSTHSVDGHGLARVIYSPPGAPLIRHPQPADLIDTMVLKPCAVTTYPEMTLPVVSVWPAEALEPLGFASSDPWDQYEDRYEALRELIAAEQDPDVDGPPSRPAADSWGSTSATDWYAQVEHRILGWPRHVQGDILPELAGAHGEQHRPSAKNAVELSDANNWRLLLQLEADDRLGSHFGEGLYFGLPAVDLAGARFERVQALTQW